MAYMDASFRRRSEGPFLPARFAVPWFPLLIMPIVYDVSRCGSTGIHAEIHEISHLTARRLAGMLSRMDAKTILDARTRRDDSQEAAARAVGVSVRTWQTWEARGCTSPSEAILRSLREYVDGAPEPA